jgi:hypothetical protein
MRRALTPLTPAQRRTFVDTLLAYETSFSNAANQAPATGEPADVEQRLPLPPDEITSKPASSRH